MSISHTLSKRSCSLPSIVYSNSVGWFIIDAHHILFPPAYSYRFIHSLKSSITSIVLPNWCCNDVSYIEFDFSRFTNLKSLKIGNDSFSSVRTFLIDGLHSLKTLDIGDDSFTFDKTGIFGGLSSTKRDEVGDFSKSFKILNCESLESIRIGVFSFTDFAGDFELRNLNSLRSIQIGEIDIISNNFYRCSFLIRGIME